jgi:integrase
VRRQADSDERRVNLTISGGHVHPHVLRHTFAARLLGRGVDVRTAQQLMGHRDIKATSTDSRRIRGAEPSDRRARTCDWHHSTACNRTSRLEKKNENFGLTARS